MLTIFVITIVRKELFEIRLSFLHSIILCKIVVNDLLNNQNILKDIFEDKRGQSQKWWRREKVEIRLEFFESLNGTTDLNVMTVDLQLHLTMCWKHIQNSLINYRWKWEVQWQNGRHVKTVERGSTRTVHLRNTWQQYTALLR